MTHSLIKSLCQVKLETNNPTNDWKWEDPGGFQWLFKQVIMNYKKEKTSPALETKKSEYILFKKKKQPRKSIYSLQQVENYHFSCDLSHLKTF